LDPQSEFVQGELFFLISLQLFQSSVCSLNCPFSHEGMAEESQGQEERVEKQMDLLHFCIGLIHQGINKWETECNTLPLGRWVPLSSLLEEGTHHIWEFAQTGNMCHRLRTPRLCTTRYVLPEVLLEFWGSSVVPACILGN